MATSLLLPLDGSPFSRRAFRVVGRLFEPATTTVTLLHVAATPEGVHDRAVRPLISEAWPSSLQSSEASQFGDHPIYATQVWESTKATVIASMEEDVQALADAGFSVRLEVRFGDPAQEIADLVEEGDVDAVVMATHGRSGLSRAVLGSVAERVLRMVHVPVVMVRGRDEGAGPEPFTPFS